MIDQNEFFRQATLKICGNLAIEQALHDALLYIREFIPADAFFMEYFDPDSSSTRTIARADLAEGAALDLVTPIPTEAHLDEALMSQDLMQKAMAVNHPEKIPLAVTMLRFHKYDEHNTSLLTMRLIHDGEFFGGLVALAEKRDAFTQDHAELLTSLAQPFTIAMVNALRHRDVLAAKDRLVDENEFFRNMTMRICGSLKIDQAMRDFVVAIGEFIPVDRLFVQIYEPDLGAMRTIAVATSEEGKPVDLLKALPESARERVEQNLTRNADFPVIIDCPEKNPVAREMLRFHGIDGWSVLRMTLTTENGRLGGMVLTAEGPDRYREEHAVLLELLRTPFAISLSNTLQHREVLRLQDLLADDNRFLQRELLKFSGDDIVGAEFGLKNVMDMVRKVSPMDSPVLLLGETGVGKDVLANAIHYSSKRCNGPLITLNCGAIPETLIDSELFGHEKGAFTGAASQKRGRFERADKGTIFLDEIGELPPRAQVRLLRVLQNNEFERVGGTKPIKTDVRVIAATNRDLGEMVKSGEFREDLWFRLNVFPVTIPPLRARREDIPALAYHFLERRSRQMKISNTPPLGPGAMERLMAYNWPGNVRELENIIERALILSPEGPLGFEGLDAPGQGAAAPSQTAAAPPAGEASLELDLVIASHIRRVLEMTGGKIHGADGAAQLLNVNPSTLRSKMKKLGIRA